MNAIPESFLSQTASLDESVLRPFPNSQKVYVKGSRPDIQVPMREITLAETHSTSGSEKNPPITVYDTSGPYSDPKAQINLRKGLEDIRKKTGEECRSLEAPGAGRTSAPPGELALGQGAQWTPGKCTRRPTGQSRY